MTADSLIARVEAAGGHLEPRGDRLRVQAPKPLPDELVEALRQHKLEILARLQAQDYETRFGQPHARLFPLPREVDTRYGAGLLVQVFQGHAAVVIGGRAVFMDHCDVLSPRTVERR